MFPVGQCVVTPGALEVMEKNGVYPLELIGRHIAGDWGDIPEEDKQSNLDALKLGNRIMSVYKLTSTDTVWIITEADRSSTTLFLPSEY